MSEYQEISMKDTRRSVHQVKREKKNRAKKKNVEPVAGFEKLWVWHKWIC